LLTVCFGSGWSCLEQELAAAQPPVFDSSLLLPISRSVIAIAKDFFLSSLFLV
jgi:hypothetical protein